MLAMLIIGTGCANGSSESNIPPDNESEGLTGPLSESDSSGSGPSVRKDEEDLSALSGTEELTDDSFYDESSKDESFYNESYPGDRLLSDEAIGVRNEYVIYCPDTELPDLFKACYPGYEAVSDPSEDNGRMVAEGRIGDMKIIWIISDYFYDSHNEERLDELLIRQQEEGASDYDWVDLFVLDEVSLEKYIEDGVNIALDLRMDLRIPLLHFRSQLPYTQELASVGMHLRGAALDISPGVFMYRRSIAKEVLGSDDPETVSEAVSSWESFRETAGKAKNAGYKMLAGYDDAFDVYAQSAEEWYSDDGTIHVDDRLMEWVETTKEFAQEGCCGEMQMWSDEWMKSITGKGDVFGYFLSAEEICTIRDSVEKDNADSFGDWGIAAGPDAWYRGGTWLCAAVNSPNTRFSGKLIDDLTCNSDVMREIYLKTGLTVNNDKVLLEQEDTFETAFFAGQETGPVFYEAAQRIKKPMADGDKWALDDIFQEAYHPYFEGKCSSNDALASFYQVAKSMIFTEDEEW